MRDRSPAADELSGCPVDQPDRSAAEDPAQILASIVETSTDAIVSKDLNGRIRTWNAGAEQIFGYTSEEAMGRPITLIIPPELHSEEASILARLRAGERIEHYETVRVDKWGNQKQISLSISPIRNSQGEIVGAAKIARDISAQKQSAAELVAVKNELTNQLADMQRLQQMSLRLSTTRDVEPILRDALSTACAISGTDQGLLSLYDPRRNELTIGASQGLDDGLLEQVAHIRSGVGAWGICLKDRCRVIVEDVDADPAFEELREFTRAAGFKSVHSTPLITRSGEFLGVLSTHFSDAHWPSDHEIGVMDLCARQAVDFIENARLYEKLREADRRKDEFLAVLAHELRNPLAPLTNSMHILRLSDNLSPDVAALQNIMETQVQHLVRLVDDLLEVSRITRGKIDLRQQPVELAAIISTAVETSRPHIDAADQQLAIQVAPDPIILNADPVRLAQVISNLLNNAAKYTPRGGQIWLTAGVHDRHAEILVRDNGIGISAEMLPHIFDMFSQVEHSGDQAQGGLGLGLAVSRGIVEMHKGTVTAHSDGPGAGSVFKIRLPIASPPRKVAPAPLPERLDLPRHRVLIVDDTRVAAHTLGRLLEALGQEVHVASNGSAALRLLALHRPDLVISDIGMPEMDGYELARRIRNARENDGVTLVALTGYGQDGDRREALEAGFSNHLVKPVSLRNLQELLVALPVPQLNPLADRPATVGQP